jgi:hypothetical protein
MVLTVLMRILYQVLVVSKLTRALEHHQRDLCSYLGVLRPPPPPPPKYKLPKGLPKNLPPSLRPPPPQGYDMRHVAQWG